MTNNTLKSTIEAIIAANALVVVTLDGTFNSKTNAPVLSARSTPEQRNQFLKSYCERISASDLPDADATAVETLDNTIREAHAALSDGNFAAAIKFTQDAATLTEQLDQPRVYYRVKQNLDLRTTAEKRAAKKAENAAKKADKQATKEAAAAAKLVVTEPTPEPVAPISEPVAVEHKGKGKKAA